MSMEPEPEPEVLSPASAFSMPLGVDLNTQTTRIALASLSVALVLLAIWIVSRRRRNAGGSALLLLGPSDAGKTAMLTSLVYNQTLPTHTSMQTNSSIISLPTGSADKTKPLLVIDVPGHPRVRSQFREHLADAQAVAFVVDASTVSRNGAAVAEHLHEVMHALTTLPPSTTPPALLVLAHKADLLKPSASSTAAAFAITRVRTVLERELEKRKASYAGGVGIEGLGEDDGKGGGAAGEGVVVGAEGLECEGGGEFRFEKWEAGEVAFVGTSVRVGEKVNEDSDEKEGHEDGLESLREWLREVF